MAAEALTVILERVRATPGCSVAAPDRLPALGSGHVLPSEVEAFYRECGGVTFFADSDYRIDIVGPHEFTPANQTLLGITESGDISDEWFIIATCGSESDVLTIDVHPDRVGRCYFSFSDVHAVAGSCPIIAETLTDLLSRILANGGDYWYWLKPGFESLGDAYD